MVSCNICILLYYVTTVSYALYHYVGVILKNVLVLFHIFFNLFNHFGKRYPFIIIYVSGFVVFFSHFLLILSWLLLILYFIFQTLVLGIASHAVVVGLYSSTFIGLDQVGVFIFCFIIYFCKYLYAFVSDCL